MAKNPIVPVLLLTDGLLALAVIAAATLGGLALLPVLRLGRLRIHQQLLFGAGLGLGLLGLLVMALGVAGLLHRPIWIAILLLAAVGGLLRLARTVRHQTTEPRSSARAEASARAWASDRPDPAAPEPVRWLWLLVCPFLALTILVACVPPGYLWAEEGNGYDVLEYHLEMPKEYLIAGRVSYAPHNVYANFPANVEMLYLLCMVLDGDAIDAAGACKLLNAALAVLTVAAAWMIGRRWSASAGVVTAVVAAGVGWLTYLSGLAYVENGMLLFAMLASAAILEALRRPGRWARWCILAGLLAGFSCGCKYTAGPMIGLPLAVGLLTCLGATAARRVVAVGLFILVQAAAFSPWAIKNTVMTGNPVFPLANGLFEAYPPGWGPAESQHFAASHSTPPDERTVQARLASLGRHIPADPDQRFGVLLLVLAAWAAVARRHEPPVRFCLALLLTQVPVWLFATHLYARFAVPLLIPLILLAGRVPLAAVGQRRIVVGLVVVGSLVNLAFSARLYTRHMVLQGQRFALEGAADFFTRGLGLGHEHLEIVNGDLPADARILMLGDAKAFYFRRPVDYCVVFNRSPFAAQVRGGAGPRVLLNWLTDRGYTHVLVNWSEIRRLADSAYGFDPNIRPELFERLVAAGLHPGQAITSRATDRIYAQLYRLPSAGH